MNCNLNVFIKHKEMACPLLSICIPTYNRKEFIDVALSHLEGALKNVSFPIEVIISDNHSEDGTKEVIEDHIASGLFCRYIRNSQNIGPDANFVQCFNEAKGKYIWIIGDDDYLCPNSLLEIGSFLQTGDYGLVHIEFSKKGENIFSVHKYDDYRMMLSDVNIMITFLSGNIINSNVVKDVNPEKYLNSFMIQVPYFIEAALLGKTNVIIYSELLDCGANSENNGGYNFFRIFMDNYLGIWKKYVNESVILRKDYEIIKRATFEKFYFDYVYNSFRGRQSLALDTRGSLRTTIKYFWYNPYVYKMLGKRYLKAFKAKMNSHK